MIKIVACHMRLTLVHILLLCTVSTYAQMNQEVLKIGDAIDEIELPNPYGQIIDIASEVDKGICIIFTNHQCNYALLYLDRIIHLESKFSEEGIKFVLVESRIESFEGSVESLEQFIPEKNVNIEYLIDLDNTLSKRFGAQSSPHAFLFRKKEDDLILTYSGSIDNNSRKPERVTKTYLSDAIQSVLLKNELIKSETKAIGCFIDKG